MAPKDDDTVTFMASRNKKSTEYTLIVACPSGLSSKEFAISLRTFARDIEKDLVSFDKDGEAQDNSLQ